MLYVNKGGFMKKNITLYYVGTKGINFGDSINPIFFERILNIKVKRGYPTNSDVVAIGSLMQMLTLKNIIRYKKIPYFLKYNLKPIITMGTGFNCDIEKSNFLNRTYRNVYPVILRGKLSHKTLEKINKKEYKDVSYGDLGLLFLYLLEKKVPKCYKLGIIPHKSDYSNPIINLLLEEIQDSTLIDLRMPPLETLERIAECETVISSSLHGLVAADSLNIPNKRIKLSNHGFDFNVDFKFDDYYSIFTNGLPNYIELTQENYKSFIQELTPEKISEDYCISYREVQNYQNQLYKTCQKLKDII